MNQERVLYFDCFAGISGDMTVGALLDLGAESGLSRGKFLAELGKVRPDEYRVEIRHIPVGGLQATDFNVILPDGQGRSDGHGHRRSYGQGRSDGHGHSDGQAHRNIFDVERVIEESGLSDRVRELSRGIFRQIAVAEAAVHGRPLEEVHFHEVGAIDSLVDIIGTAICIDMLRPDRILASPLHLGGGFVECAHGTLPVPAPATAEILKGVPVYSTEVRGELVTPTGAAIVRCLAERFGPLPPMRVERIGYGRGKKEYGIPNILRVYLGELTGGAE